MAIVKAIKNSIKAHEAVYKAINYIVNPEKVYAVSTENCCGDAYELSKQFYITRKSFNKDRNILSHHYVQSFSPEDNITPEQAHQIGLELIKKIGPGYQIVLGTHIDKGHIHNHFIINSCNIETGYKWHGNKATLQNMRDESDILCKRYGFSVIDTENESKYKEIDQTTYQLAKKGKSWKVNLVKDIDEALASCNSKIEFIDFLNQKEYSVKYMKSKITVQKKGEKKGIRLDTLAEQFGTRYSKESIEKALGCYVPSEEKKIKRTQKAPLAKSEWERFEKHIFADTPVRNVSISRVTEEFKKAPQKFSLRLYLYSLLQRKKNKHIIDLSCIPITDNYKLVRAVKSWNVNKLQQRTIGNISYRRLSAAQGENYRIIVNADLLPKLFNQPIFYCALINTGKGTATLTIKEKDRQLLSKILGVSDVSALDKQNLWIKNRDTYQKIKSAAAEKNVKVEYLIISPEQLHELQENYIEVAYFKKDDKYNIAFDADNKKRISSILYPQKQQETEFQKNNRINNELKKQSALSGEKLRYKLISKEQLLLLQKSADINYAYFYKKDKEKYNVVYLESDTDKVNKAIQKQEEKQQLELSL